MSTITLATLEELQAYEQVRAGVTDYNARLVVALQAASALIEKLTRRSFSLAARTEILTSRNNRLRGYDLFGSSRSGTVESQESYRIYLPGWPLDTAETITVNYDPGRTWDASGDLVAANGEYYVDTEGEYILINISTAYARDSIKVTYTSGYTVVTDGVNNYQYMSGVDGDLKMACLIQAQSIHRSVSSALPVAEDNTANRGYVASADVQALIGKYVMPLVSMR